ncbi:hypothetical protein [Rhizorhabdus histidinilytica]|uniref:Uncharacterized protein n=1 Tax=Rhizorhabdus histidinilytica TaxID=439228 RepID=A0A1T5CI21_9SPHN|nr:hypothetical protein [Rhizorhabdus histidinilytica]SKB58971.1 hypothetical protein SAMN06295920_10471 [Rhizorhabdus histidinilytica]
MPQEDLRLEALRLAVSFGLEADTVRLAAEFYDFLVSADRAALADEAKAAMDRLAN